MEISKLKMRFILTFLVLFLLPVHNIHAEGYEWQLVQSSGRINDLYYDSYSSAVYALADDLGVLKSTNYGATWVAKNNGIGIFPSEKWRFKKISGNSNGHIFLATQGQYFYRSSDGGNTWQQATATGLIGNDPPVSMTFDSYTNKLFVTSNGAGVFRSADLGETWTQINIDSWNNVYSIYSGKADASGATGMLLAGTYNSGINKSTDGGSTWISKGSIYWMVDIISGPNDWLFAISDGWQLDRSKDYGETWTNVISSPSGGDLAYDPVSGYVYSTTGSNYIKYSSDGGDSWGDITISSDTSVYTTEIECLPNQTIIVGTASGIYRQGPPVDTNEPPASPVLSSPSNGFTVFGTSVKLYWQKSTDPEGGNVTYRLQIAENSGFTTNLRTFNVDENGALLGAVGFILPFFAFLGWRNRSRKKNLILITAGILLTASLFIGCGSGGWNVAGVADDRVSFEVTGLESGKTYYWRVLAVDEENETSEPGETRSFTVH